MSPFAKAIGFTLAFLFGGTARAEEKGAPARPHTRQAPSVRAFCEATEAAAASESALMSSPWVFGNAGTLLGTEEASLSTAETRTGWPRLRVQAGVGLSPTRMRRGALARDLARAECRRFAAQRELEGLSEALRQDGRAAFEAKAGVLDAALSKAREFLLELERRLDASVATVDDYRALLHRVSALEAELYRTREALAELPRDRAIAGQWGQARRAAELAEWETSRLAGSLRESEAFEVELRGGYDNVIDVAQRLPAFGNLTLRFSPGYFWQRSADQRATRARHEFRRQEVLEQAPDVRAISERLKLAEARVGGLAQSIARLDQRLSALNAVSGTRAELHRTLLWLDLAELRAELAFASARAEELRSVLRGLSQK